MLQFSLGLMAGVMMGVFIMCLMIMAGRGQETPEMEGKKEESLHDMVMPQVSHPNLNKLSLILWAGALFLPETENV